MCGHLYIVSVIFIYARKCYVRTNVKIMQQWKSTLSQSEHRIPFIWLISEFSHDIITLTNHLDLPCWL